MASNIRKTFVFLFFSLVGGKLWASSAFTFLSGLSHSLHIPEHILTFGFVGLMILGIGMCYRLSLSGGGGLVLPAPTLGVRSIIEAYGQFIYGQCQNIIGEKEGPKHFSFISALFICVLINNLIGLVPGFAPATENINTTLALGVFSFVYYNIKGCQELGTLNYLKHFAGPLWYMAVLIFPIEIFSNLVRPLSLALRLRGNIFGDHLIMSIFGDLVPLFVPIAFLCLGLLVSVIQAYVFSVLSMVYISLATAHHDHDEH